MPFSSRKLVAPFVEVEVTRPFPNRAILRRRLLFLPLLCAFAPLCEILSLALLAAPEIAHFVPHAVLPGKRTILTFSGRDLDKASNLWTSFAGTAQRVPNTNSSLISFAVNCPPDARGIHALQLSGPEGASNFQLVMIDALPTNPHHDTHRTPATAHKITPPIAVDCILKSEQIDYYTFPVRADKTVSIEVLAHRIGSQMDPVVRALDPTGRELAFCDDDGSVWKDARFQFRAPADGDYILAIHDVGYGGGNAFDYRLRVTHEPLVWFTFPLADPFDNGVPVEEVGAGLSPTRTGSPADPSPAVLLTTIPQLVESEPNNTTSSAQPASAPIILHGRIQNADDTDYFRPDVAKNDKLIFQSQTRSLGSPCDLLLILKKPDGTVLARSDSGSPGDAALTNTFGEAGPVHLEVRELSGYATPNAPYRIKLQKFTAGFTLATEKNILNLKPGESTKLKITATRHDFDGPIQLRLEPPIDGLSLEENTIPEKKNELEVKLTASNDLKPGSFHHVKLVGSNTNGFTSAISTRPALRAAFPLMLNSPSILEEIVAIAIRE